MSEPILLFTAIVLSSTIAIVTSVVLLAVVLRTREEGWARRLAMAALLPWGALELARRGRRALPAVWATSIVVYAVLRVVAAVTVPYA